VKDVCKPTGEQYAPDSVFYLCLGKYYAADSAYFLCTCKYIIFGAFFPKFLTVDLSE